MLRDDIARYTKLSGNDGEHTPIGIIGAFLDGYETGLKDISKREWIPVSERLPEVDQDVLATTRWGDVTIAERLNIGPDCWFICEGEANAHTEDIIAWQPLPEPYKAESEDKE